MNHRPQFAPARIVVPLLGLLLPTLLLAQRSGPSDLQRDPAPATLATSAPGLDRGPDQGPDRTPEAVTPDPVTPFREGAAILALVPSRQAAAPGTTVGLTLVVLGARGVARLPVTVRYDPGLLELLEVKAGAAWQKGPAPVLLHDASRPGELVVGLARLGRSPLAIQGTAELLELTFRALSPGEGQLRLERFALVGPGNQTQTARAQPARVVVR